MRKRVRSWHHVHTHKKRVAGRRHHRLLTRFFASPKSRSNLFQVRALVRALGSSIAIDVDDAVEAQLDTEHKPSPRDPDKEMEGGYGYTTDTMDGFLTAVAKRLAQEGHSFRYDNPFIQTALTAKLRELKVKITSKTT